MAELPWSLQRTPSLDAWLRFTGDGRVVVRTGKVELGQGISTAVASIAAFELDIPIERVDVETGSTEGVPNEGITAGSMSIQMTGATMRQACAEVRQLALNRAALRLGVDVADLTIGNGQVLPRDGTNEPVSYADLFSDGIGADAGGNAAPRPATPSPTVQRIDLPAKLSGARAFLQDEIEGNVLHARVVRPRTPGLPIVSSNADPVLALPHVVQVVRDGHFVAVLAETEPVAVRAAELLRQHTVWAEEPPLPPATPELLRASVTDSLLIGSDGAPTDEPIPPRLSDEATLRAGYWKPYHLHGSIAPSAALARWDGDQLTVWSHAQGPFLLRGAIAEALDLPAGTVTVHHGENAGCYGHNGADDAAFDAALAARVVPGRKVLLKYSRADEHLNEPLSPATHLELAARMDGDRITDWHADVYSETHSGRPAPGQQGSNLRAAWDLSPPREQPPVRPGRGPHGGIHRNADPYYTFPNRRVVKHLAAPRVRTSSTRGLGAFANVFAIESFIDELAAAAGVDPVALRLAHLDDQRAREVVSRAGRIRSDWLAEGGPGAGVGLAFARYKNVQTYCAVVVRLQVDGETAAIRLRDAAIVADAGRVVDPDGLAHQLEGAFVQAASWTLMESVSFDAGGRTTTDWETYPILRFADVPDISVDVLDRPDTPSLGAGEAATGPTPAAIANAIAVAAGIRARSIPFTPETLREAAAE